MSTFNLDTNLSNDFQPQLQLVQITLVQRVVLLGIFFRKPKAEYLPRAVDERRIKNWG